jgi:hypothetical protein
MTEPREQDSNVERANAAVTRAVDEARHLAARVVAVGAELVEDVWAEAKAIRREKSSER